jgi:phage terminase small subunit
MAGLTPKQEKFCLNLFSGMSQREAYIQAGYSANSSPEVIDVTACNLVKSPKVALRLQELKNKAETSRVMSVIERKERLSEIAKDKTDKRTSIAAIAELNKMEHLYSENQVNVNVGVSIREVEVRLSGNGS